MHVFRNVAKGSLELSSFCPTLSSVLPVYNTVGMCVIYMMHLHVSTGTCVKVKGQPQVLGLTSTLFASEYTRLVRLSVSGDFQVMTPVLLPPEVLELQIGPITPGFTWILGRSEPKCPHLQANTLFPEPSLVLEGVFFKD